MNLDEQALPPPRPYSAPLYASCRGCLMVQECGFPFHKIRVIRTCDR